MAATIQANVEALKTTIKNEIGPGVPNPSPTADRLQQKGIAAIVGGPAEWAEFMKEFSTSAVQLARLIPTDGSFPKKEMREARAYLVANSTCGVATFDKLDRTVSAELDQPFP